ncbi:LOW QUALITY PROTEIN: hypothetical protein KUTG_09032, partial [Kutzneria sp. 744]
MTTTQSPTRSQLLAAWARELTWADVPERTRAAARSQVVSNLAAVRASLRLPVGRALVAAYGPPTQEDPTRAAQVLAALATAIDFDEVAYSGHISAGAVNVAIAEARHGGLDGEGLLTAAVAANECAARISAATILSPFFRGQTNTHTHLASAAVARLHARRAPAEQWTSALGLALGIVPVPLHHGVVTSDLKALSASGPVRLALDACDAAAAGLTGSESIIEAPEGLLAQLSVVPVPEAVTLGLGRRWHTDTLTYKRFPGSAYLHAAFDCAERLHRTHGPLDASRVQKIVVHASLLTWQLERKTQSRSSPATAPRPRRRKLSVGYGVACLLLKGSFGQRPGASGAGRRGAVGSGGEGDRRPRLGRLGADGAGDLPAGRGLASGRRPRVETAGAAGLGRRRRGGGAGRARPAAGVVRRSHDGHRRPGGAGAGRRVGRDGVVRGADRLGRPGHPPGPPGDRPGEVPRHRRPGRGAGRPGAARPARPGPDPATDHRRGHRL